jgi:p-aminobenzoyl-glutamate transporter AbgT
LSATLGVGLFHFNERNNMKKLIIVVVLTFIVTTSTNKAGWIGNDSEREQREKAEQQLQQEQQAKGNWEGLAFVLGIGCVVTLITGAAIGSRGRKNARIK